MAAFISLIKSIDNSTVREGELRNFSSVSGVVSQLESLVSKTKGEGAFAPGVEEDIKSTVAALRGNLEKMLAGFGEFYGGEAERFGLSRNAVTGQPKPEFAGSTSTLPNTKQARSAEDIQAEFDQVTRELEEVKRQLAEAG